MSSIPIPGMYNNSFSSFHPVEHDPALETIMEAKEPPSRSGSGETLRKSSKNQDLNSNEEDNTIPEETAMPEDVVSPAIQESGPEDAEESIEEKSLPSENESESTMKSLVRVCKTLKLTETQIPYSKQASCYEGTIRFKNISPRWPVAYSVIMVADPKSPCSYFFPKDRPMGYVEPGETKEIHMVRTVKPGNEEIFAQELSTMRIAVACLPIYYRSQLDQRKIEKYWGLVGSDSHPAECCELHEIQLLYPTNPDPFSMVYKMCRGNTTHWNEPLPKTTWIPSPSPPITEGELEMALKLLAPTESDHTKGLIYRDQVREVKEGSSALRKEMDRSMRICRVTCLVWIGLGLLYVFSILYEHIQPFEPPPPPPPIPTRPFWKFW